MTLLVSLSFFLAGCVSQQSEVATKFGYKKSVKVEAGPYQLHYGKSGTNEFLLLGEGNWDVLSRETGEGSAIYLDGRPFIHFDRSPNGLLTNLQMYLMGAHGKQTTTLVDRDADGQWDFKMDEIAKKSFIWKDGHWVERWAKH